MRITREALLKAANEAVTQRSHAQHDLVAAYVVGSLLTDEPLLGGTTDIDLVFILSHAPDQPREVTRLTSEVSLDIAYYNESEYRQPRHLRTNPWVGSSLCESRLALYDFQHWFEFIQASVAAQFYEPENTLSRAQGLLEKSRSIWFTLQSSRSEHPQILLDYLKAVKAAVNSIAVLSGAPLTERRFLLKFPERAKAIEHPRLVVGLLALIGADLVGTDAIQSWLPDWHSSLTALQEMKAKPIRLGACRLPYYERAVDAVLGSDQPQASLWPLMRTWTLAASQFEPGSPHLAGWIDACEQLHLGTAHIEDRLSALDAYLDTIEETLESWGKENGV
jgi:hypothetical protein